MITEKRLEESLKYLAETDEKSAEASANVKYLDRLLKRKKALYITGEASLKSVSAKEQAFYASDTYKNAVEELFEAEVKSSTLENKRDKEQMIIDLFRTLEASRRKNNIV
jgi:predicted ATP-dependent serine protease